jgi:hypothetical protein
VVARPEVVSIRRAFFCAVLVGNSFWAIPLLPAQKISMMSGAIYLL